MNTKPHQYYDGSDQQQATAWIGLQAATLQWAASSLPQIDPRDRVLPARTHLKVSALPNLQATSLNREALKDLAWRILGSVSITIGLINALIPFLPTTVFLLIGLWAYGKGAPELKEKWLNHPRFGRALRLWDERRMVSRQGKIAASAGIALSFMFTALLIGPKLITALLGLGMVGLIAYLVTRPEPDQAVLKAYAAK